MRLPPIPPAKLTDAQRPLDTRLRKDIGRWLQGFVSERADGALVGPFAPMLHFPQFGGPVWDYITALSENSTLPKPAHEVAILVTGARFRSRYEIYAHEKVAAAKGLSEAKIATIVSGNRPSDLTAEEAAAYDTAFVLVGGGQLPEATYQAALKAFGEEGVAELTYLVGAYCLVSVLLNAYDVSVPGREEGVG
ncbi:carboxymuconolactone decarboxylase family protein [Roseomonas populi]|uniref:4-carboxymuconolactone decarboxylase n=1 Tax=Roseomonas populi TaxID=3121582 RepID=A0ABT1X0S2_9PROT|nr:4-carboxymuconolactone decarboxylase [Roseomonas pecuniae]MCR0981700.1 4-carboxymuconolactone decarboxylase [Roseomonas pecuniae]